MALTKKKKSSAVFNCRQPLESMSKDQSKEKQNWLDVEIALQTDEKKRKRKNRNLQSKQSVGRQYRRDSLEERCTKYTKKTNGEFACGVVRWRYFCCSYSIVAINTVMRVRMTCFETKRAMIFAHFGQKAKMRNTRFDNALYDAARKTIQFPHTRLENS